MEMIKTTQRTAVADYYYNIYYRNRTLRTTKATKT